MRLYQVRPVSSTYNKSGMGNMYMLLRKTTINTKLCMFQYKTLIMYISE